MTLLFMGQTRAVDYTLADLEVLSTENNYEEFFKHALDIRPSERQDVWKAMVSKMADVFSRRVLASDSVTTVQFKKAEGLMTWPSLRSDDIYRGRRQEIGLRYLKQCLRSEKPCWKELQAFWELDKRDPDLAVKLAELVHTYPDAPISSWIFLESALKSPLSEFYCKRDFVMTSLWGKLEIDYIRLGIQGDLLRKLDQTMHPDCLPSLNQTAQRKLYEPTKETDRELAFQILKAQMKVNRDLEDFFYTVYLLERPSKGELFNYSWNRLKELGKDVTRRDLVLSVIKEKLDPLPDAIMGSLDQTKKKAIAKLFSESFPEYLNYYSEQCLNFYSGKKKFPDGNPTVHCQDLMKEPWAAEVVGTAKVAEFKKIKKI